VPAAAVIPAPVAYINVVAVKKLVVGPVFGKRPPAARRLSCAVRAVQRSRHPVWMWSAGGGGRRATCGAGAAWAAATGFGWSAARAQARPCGRGRRRAAVPREGRVARDTAARGLCHATPFTVRKLECFRQAHAAVNTTSME